MRVSISSFNFSKCLILLSGLVAPKQYLHSSDLIFRFMTHFFVPFVFFLSSLSCF